MPNENLNIKTFDILTQLPNEIAVKILNLLSPCDLAVCCQVSFSWRKLSDDSQIWKTFCQKRGWLNIETINHSINENNDKNYTQSDLTKNSPQYPLIQIVSEKLGKNSFYKRLYAAACYLQENWRLGRYRVKQLLKPHEDRISAFDSDGHYLVTGTVEVAVFDLFAYKEIASDKTSHCLLVNTIRIKGNSFLTGSNDGNIRLFNLPNCRLLQCFSSHLGPVSEIVFSSSYMVSSSTDFSIKIWNKSNFELVHSLKKHRTEIECLAVYKDRAATGSWDKTIILWDLTTGAVLKEFLGHTEVVNCLQFDDDKLVSGSADSTLRIWCLSDTNQSVLYGHTAEIYCLSYNSDIIASGGSDSTVRLWAHDGTAVTVLEGHLGVVRTLRINDSILISAGDRKIINVWDLKTFKLLNRLHRQPILIRLLWLNESKIITASPNKPGTISILEFW